MFIFFLLTQLNALMIMQIFSYEFHKKRYSSLTNGVQYVSDECWKITGIHLKFVYLVKLFVYLVSPENLGNASKFESWGLNTNRL